MSAIDRRSLLILGLTAAFGVPACSKCTRLPPIALAFANLDSAKAVGRAALKGLIVEQSADQLVQELLKDVPVGSDLMAHVRARHHEDFELGRTVRVRKWLLSETEAKAYALLALV